MDSSEKIARNEEFGRLLDERLAQRRRENEDRQKRAPEHLRLTSVELEALERDQLLMESVRLVNELNGSASNSPLQSIGIPLTRLQHAAMTGIVFSAKVALLEGDDVNDCGELGSSPLSLATEKGHQTLIDLLIKCGAK